MVSNAKRKTSHRAAGLLVGALLVASPLTLTACGNDAPTTAAPSAAVSDVTSVTLIRANGQQAVRAQVLNPTDESSSYTVTVAIASSNGTKIGSTTVDIANVPAGKKKSGTSEPLSPSVPLRSQLIVTGIDRTVP